MIVIAALLITCGVCEEVFVDRTISSLKQNSYQLEQLLDENKENIDCEPVKAVFNKLKIFWNKTEPKLGYIVNFEKIRPINESIVKLDGAIEENDFSVAMENVKTIENYSKTLNYIMGISVNNIL